jgi:hypothetical protein
MIFPRRFHPSPSNPTETVCASHPSMSQNVNDRTTYRSKRTTRLWTIRIKSTHNHVWDNNADHHSLAQSRSDDSRHRMTVSTELPPLSSLSVLPRLPTCSLLSLKFPTAISRTGATSRGLPTGERGQHPGHSWFVSDTSFFVRFHSSILIIFQCFLIVFGARSIPLNCDRRSIMDFWQLHRWVRIPARKKL